MKSKQVLTKILSLSACWADWKLEPWISSYFTMLVQLSRRSDLSLNSCVSGSACKRGTFLHISCFTVFIILCEAACALSQFTGCSGVLLKSVTYTIRDIFTLLSQNQHAELACALAVIFVHCQCSVFRFWQMLCDDVFGRNLFSRKQREAQSAPGWKLFGKVPLRESPPKDSKIIQQVCSHLIQIESLHRTFLSIF